MIDAKTISEFDQHKMRMKEIVAPALKSFYDALRAEGFNDDQAMHLTDGYFDETFLTCPGCAACMGGAVEDEEQEGEDDE